MFFIAGLKHRRHTEGTGRFRCPNEGADRPYEHVRVRRWLTLFFLPLLPLGTVGEHVTCRSCGSVYPPSVIEAHALR